MEFLSLLSDSDITIWGQTYNIYLNWIGKIIRWLIESVGNVGLGVILFSLALKIIVMPFDVYQRITMRKQNVQMKENQEKMAKLQKQYANNKELYNQKVMEMYKENGFSVFSSCLPMILSMVIFIVAINAFNAYAQYAAVENYNMMVKSYNTSVLSHAPELTENGYVISVNDNVIVVKSTDENDFVYYSVPNTGDTSAEYIENAKKTYYVDAQKLMSMSAHSEGLQVFLDMKNEDGSAKYSSEDACKQYVISLAQTDVVNFYENTIKVRTKFFWMKNIWNADVSWKHPVSVFKDFEAGVKNQKFDVDGVKTELAALQTDVYAEGTYFEVTKKLDVQQGQANGYFILVLLSIGTILLQQWITMRSQKEQSQYSTVDGQGAQQQKTTMIMMTVMFAFFSFMYSGAFSIYMITSNLTSLASTIIINKMVDKSVEKKEQKAMQAKYNQRFPGREYKGNSDKKDK